MFHTLLHVSVLIGFIICHTIYESDNNLVKPRFERNKVNKGVWLRHKQEDPFEKSNHGNFIFRANSLDAESIAQNGFDPFSSQQQGMVSSYVMRNKRSPHSKNKHRLRKSLNNVNKSAVTPSVFHDYPYEVTVLLDSPNNKNIDYNVFPKYETKVPIEDKEKEKEEISINKLNIIKDNNKQDTDNTVEYLKNVINLTESNVTTPKRSMDYGYEFKKVNLLDVLNKSKINHAMKNIKGDVYHAAQDPNVENNLLIEPKVDVKTPKPVTEKGLIKVLAMLTRTFKKIMKQHNDIKTMHTQMQTINDEFKVKIETHTKKLQDFDIKYNFFLKIIEKLKTFQDKLKCQEDSYRKKDEEMSKNLIQFESQQKKFLAQQQQFFNLQKLLLAQNEKINQKQNAIAKAQTEISHRQNSFARVLEKAKKLYGSTKYPKLTTSILKPKEITKNVTKIEKVTETLQTTTESIKIDLFSISPNIPIKNQDQLILKEKDEKSVDDLIYKYYFNNTFIDSIIKNKILSGYFLTDKTYLARNAKHKRNKHKINNTVSELQDTTILLPVASEPKTLHRERRWINHHSKKKHRRKHQGKEASSKKLINNKKDNKTNIEATEKIAVKENNVLASDPFLSMATSFCNEIGQNSTKQILGWCIEKALRRLKSLDTKLVQPPPAFTKQVEIPHFTISELSYIATLPPGTPVATRASAVPKSTSPVPLTTDFKKNTPRSHKTAEFDVFFPDNDELESNLKQFELTKDTEGNVYYDGSLHESDIVGGKSNAESDFLPEFDGHSRMDVDTKMMGLQSKRQFYARRMTANLIKKQETEEKARRKVGTRRL